MTIPSPRLSRTVRPRRSKLLAALVAVALVMPPARAASLSVPLATAGEPGASLWSAGLHSGARLLDGGAAPDGPAKRLAAVEIRLDPHYKTYWRTPGDSGLPPVFDWSASKNVRSVEVAWPAPSRFSDAGGSSIGYKDRVVFPLTVTPEDATKPVVLDLRLDYAVCDQVCIPAHAEPRLPLGGARVSTPQGARIAQALGEVPATGTLSATALPGLRSVRASADGASLLVEAQVPATGSSGSPALVDIFAEGPDGWTFAAPIAGTTEPVAGGHRITYRINVDERPADGVLKDLPVTLTMVAGEAALEVAIRLDAAPPPP